MRELAHELPSNWALVPLSRARAREGDTYCLISEALDVLLGVARAEDLGQLRVQHPLLSRCSLTDSQDGVHGRVDARLALGAQEA
jgi:hypothetical protein